MFIVGITGGTASGKSTFVRLLKQHCNELSINFISQDDYYKDTSELSFAQKSQLNFDHPSALDFELLHQHLLSLSNYIPIEKPNYSFITHQRLPKTTHIQPLPYLVLEGILILSDPKIKQLCDKTIFIDAPETVRLKRRIARDIIERERSEESIRFQFREHIKPMHAQFIAPLKTEVDYIFDGTKSFEQPLEIIHQLLSNVDY